MYWHSPLSTNSPPEGRTYERHTLRNPITLENRGEFDSRRRAKIKFKHDELL